MPLNYTLKMVKMVNFMYILPQESKKIYFLLHRPIFHLTITSYKTLEKLT